MRATFPQFVVELKLSPQSGKTFNDNSTKREPLSAQGATFPQFVVKLKLSPQSGKTFNDNSTKRKPLSAQGATLPEAERQKVCALCRLGISENGCKRKPLSAQGATLLEGESFSAGWEDYLFSRLGFKTSAIHHDKLQ